jgi:hypothetical protein
MLRLRRTCAHLIAPYAMVPSPTAGIDVDAATVIAAPDSYGNRWALTAKGRGVAVSPSFVPPITSLGPDEQPWMPVEGPHDQGGEALVGVSPDEAGFVWLATATRLWAMSPRAAESGPFEPGPGHAGKPTANTAGPEWRLVPCAPLFKAAIAGLGRSHADAPAVLLIPQSGDMVELMIGADGNVTVGPPTARPGAGVWEPLGRLPAGNHDIFCCELGGKLWLSGGLTVAGFPAHNHCFDELWSMDPSTGTWETTSHMPLPRMYNGLVNFNGEIWAIGGHANREQPTSARGWRDSLNVTECLVTGHIFNPTTHGWRDAPDLNVRRPRPFPGGPCVVVASGRIWALATGRDSNGRETVESIGDGETRWRMEGSLPRTVLQHDNEWSWAAGGVATVLGDVIYLCAHGGFISLDTSGADLEWNTSLAQHPTSAAAEPNGQPMCACVVGHKAEVWVLGGAGRTSGDTHIFTPAAEGGQGSWRVGPSMPTAQAWAGAASHAGHLYVLSGGHKMQFHPDPMAGWGGGATHYDNRCWRLIEQ